LLDKTFQMPDDFNVQDHLALEFQNQTPVQARLRFAPEAAHVALDNRAMWQSYEEQADGSVMVTITLPDLQWAASMAFGFGPILTVLEPDELRQRVSEWAKAVAERYTS